MIIVVDRRLQNCPCPQIMSHAFERHRRIAREPTEGSPL
jgi:hypothetical protein